MSVAAGKSPGSRWTAAADKLPGRHADDRGRGLAIVTGVKERKFNPASQFFRARRCWSSGERAPKTECLRDAEAAFRPIAPAPQRYRADCGR